jgi:uncharacterized protein (TIGR02145 family)
MKMHKLLVGNKIKKLIFLLLPFLFFISCQKQIVIEDTDVSEEIRTSITSANNANKIQVCHHDKGTGTTETIYINETAWPAHQDHGDLMGDCSSVITNICGKDWMIKNLEVTTYRDGTPIPEVTDPSAWASLTTGAWCYYDNNPANGIIYGKLYNWHAVYGDSNGDQIKDKELAPPGWHIPTDAEWTALVDCLGGESVAGGKLKEAGTAHWFYPNTDGTNSSGFTALPGGSRHNWGSFEFLGPFGYYWTSTDYPPGSDASNRVLFYSDGTIAKSGDRKQAGFSVRCVRD